MGKGFPIDALAADVDTVLLFACGTGISPIKAAIESGKLDGKKVCARTANRETTNPKRH
jgi:ferredoxin-NADP reductase